MKKFILCFVSCLMLLNVVSAQQGSGSKFIILSQDFESGVLPSGWTNFFGAATFGWQFGTDLSSGFWNIPAHTTYACANDDGCNCDMSDVNLTTQPFVLPAGAASLEFDYFCASSSDVCEVQISVNSGLSFTTLATLAGTGGTWIDNSVIDLSGYSSNDAMIRFHYSDAGSWAWGFCIDNVEISSPGTDDLSLISISPSQCIAGNDIFPGAVVFNNGINTATDFSVNIKISQGSLVIYNEVSVLTGQSLSPMTAQNVLMPVPFNIPMAGVFAMKATVIMTGDAFAGNNSDSSLLSVISIPPYTDFAYAINSVDKSLNAVDLSSGALTSIAAFDVINFPMSLEFIGNALYVFRNSGQVEIVYADGTLYPLGIISGLNSGPLAATWCELNGKTYVVDFNDSVSSLYELDMNSLEASYIGVLSTGIFIAAEATETGEMYGVNITDDNLYSIDLATGAATALGNTGLALNYGQDISWDSNTGTLYGMLYDESQGGAFGTFNTSTGAFANISVPGDQIAAFAVNSAWTSLPENGIRKILLYPNPADDYFIIDLEKTATVIMSDISGRTVLVRQVSSGEPVNLSGIVSGVYLVTIVADNVLVREKLIIR